MTNSPAAGAGPQGRPFAWWEFLLLGATTAVIVALIDSGPGVLAGRIPDLTRLIWIPFALTALTAFAGYLLLALAALALVGAASPARRAAAALAASAAVVVGSGFLVRILLTGLKGVGSTALIVAAGAIAALIVARLTWSFALKNDVGLRLTRAGWFRGSTALGTFGFLCALGALVTDGSTPFPPARPLAAERPPRIILLSVDTLRRDHISCYNPAGTATPNIDRLCRDSVVFDNARSPSPWTLPSFASIMTGVSPLVHKAVDPRSAVPGALPRLAEALREAGYRTRAVVTNILVRPGTKLSQGFMDYKFFPPHWTLASAAGRRVWTRLFPRLLPVDASTDNLTRTAIDVLRADKDVPLFLWLHYLDPHMPYTPPARWLGQGTAPSRIGNSFGKKRLDDIRGGYFVPDMAERVWIEQLYAAEVRYVDDGIGKILDVLEELGIYDDSLIVFVSDHGDEFWDHGGFEHGHTVYDELLRVPFMVKLPGRKAPQRIGALVSSQSIAATILDVAGIRSPRFPKKGSLRPFWEGDGGEPPHPILLSTAPCYFEDRLALFLDGHKYIRWTISGKEELYDLRADPREQQSIASSSGEMLARARTVLEDRLAQETALRQHLGLGESGERAKIDAATHEQLRALGYER